MAKKTRKRKSNIYLYLEVENFGPVKKANIELRPLTIFIGQNNSGKSYMAMLIHTIFESNSFIRPIVYRLKRVRDRFSDLAIREEVRKILKDAKLMGEIKEFLNKLKINEEKILPNEIKKIFVKKVLSAYRNIFSKELIKIFATEPSKLVRFNQKSFIINIKNNFTIIFDSKKNNINILPLQPLEERVDAKITKKETKRFAGFEFKKENEKITINFEVSDDIPAMIYVDMLFTAFLNGLAEIDSDFNVSYYLPSARAGIIQGHKAIISSILRELPYLGIKKVEIPTFPGVVADFLAFLVEIDSNKESKFYKIAKMLESEVLGGEIKLVSKEEYTLPEIIFRQHGKDIPIHIASSGVSELAPLILYLKYIVEPNSLLIIEEPEAHLHPEAQRILAKYIVRLIRKGVKILITTHSDYLLEQLSNFVILSSIPSKKREELGYMKYDYLKPDEVSFYLFKLTEDGAIVEHIEVTKDEGIPPDELVKIQEEMYREYITLKSVALRKEVK